MMFTLIVVAYVLGVVGFYFYDAAIGFGFEWDDVNVPSLYAAAMVWPLVITILVPIKLLILLGKRYDDVKKIRLKKEELRLQMKEDEDLALKQFEEELEDERETQNRTQSVR